MTVSKSTLDRAKAFLCWDVFDNVAIQLVPLKKAAAFYYPPQSDLHSIVLFFDPRHSDFSEPLFLLFHEAGHKQQWENLGKEFDEMMAIPTGPQRQAFEAEAWRLARSLFARFVENQTLNPEVLQRFDSFAQKAVESYGVNSNR